MNFFVSREKLIIWGILCFIAIITGTIVGFRVEDGGIGLYTTLAIISLGICPYVKRFILFVGRNVIDFATALDLILGVTILIAGIYFTKELYINYWWFVLGALLYIVITVLKNYVLYLLIDIKDSLHKLAYGETEEVKINTQMSEDMKECPHCGKLIKQTAKKCRYCGEWLNEENKGAE
ncbi:MAG: zinc ribbon domain-containing protein [Candidatus Gastranaerophilales bacterium]|nr:zinc ribbon domain-containing protein [Candidatus Gastranaerophilales bacterium]MCM1338881.1 zinc ribbon domain-containing protein [Muribaculaceae bacterium]